MKLREKLNAESISYSDKFNIYGIGEIIVNCEDGDRFSDSISNYDVFLKKSGKWKDLRQAFQDKDIITDNYNTSFFEPSTDEDKERGFTLY
jgi:hypothetical protein